MSLLRATASRLELITGVNRSEVEPSVSNRRADKWIVKVTAYWKEVSCNYSAQDGSYNFEDDGMIVEGFWRALPIRAIYQSKGAGELWDGKFMAQTMKNVDTLHDPFHVPAFGGKLQGGTLAKMDDGTPVDIADYYLINTDGPGMGYNVALTRDPGSDVVPDGPEIKNNKRAGYVAEQHFTGEIVFYGVRRIPETQRGIV